MPNTTPVLSVEAITASFLYSTLPKIVGRPTFTQIFAAQKLQQVNAASIRTTNGGGAHGYLGAILPPATYATIAPGTPWVVPIWPGPHPVIPEGPPAPTAAVLRFLTDKHTENIREHQQDNNVEHALKNQLIDCFDMAYLEGYKEQYVQFGNRRIGAFYVWLYQQYGQLSPQDKALNTKNFHSEWDISTPFESYAAKIEKCAEIARIGGTPFSNEQMLDNALAIVYNMAMYFEPLRQWNRLPAADHTWTNFKTNMAVAQTELIAEQTIAQRSGFGNQHSANAAAQLQEQHDATVEALANLATAAATDRTTLGNLTNLLKDKDAQIKKLEAAMLSLKATGAIRTRNNTKALPDPNGYCWSHGYRVCVGHNSMTCSLAATDPNHKKDATRENNMGGSQKGKP
jgi:hypothetical protein